MTVKKNYSLNRKLWAKNLGKIPYKNEYVKHVLHD